MLLRSLTNYTKFSTQVVWKISTAATTGAIQSRWRMPLSTRGFLATFTTTGKDSSQFKPLKLVMWRSTGLGTFLKIQTTHSSTITTHSTSRF
jgi:hypothetical protein